jgi:hypothetical protein
METRRSLPQTLMKLVLTAMLISPFLSMFAGIFLPHPPVAVIASPEDWAQWDTARLVYQINAYIFSIFVYFIGFWLTYSLLRRGSLRRAPGLWWCSLVFGVLTALQFPLGTILALPCVVILLKDRAVFYRPKLTDSSDGTSQPPNPPNSSQPA